eukprot:scaffold279287_cov31-Tisochrysis_lutea.AAC.1
MPSPPPPCIRRGRGLRRPDRPEQSTSMAGESERARVGRLSPRLLRAIRKAFSSLLPLHSSSTPILHTLLYSSIHPEERRNVSFV